MSTPGEKTEAETEAETETGTEAGSRAGADADTHIGLEPGTEDGDATGPATPEAEEPGTAAEEAGEVAVEGDPAAPEEPVESEVARWRDLAHRTAADFDNFRKRAAKDRTDAIRYANASLLEELLPVIDNFEWGLQAASEDEGSPIYQGMAMVQKQLLDFLESQGVETIDARGQEFDANLHDAIAQEPHDDVPENHVVSQTRKGYRLQGRLIRPASVTVSRGPASES